MTAKLPLKLSITFLIVLGRQARDSLNTGDTSCTQKVIGQIECVETLPSQHLPAHDAVLCAQA